MKTLCTLLSAAALSFAMSAQATYSFKATPKKNASARKVAGDESIKLSCFFEKTYDFNHLQSHPKQKVISMSGEYNSERGTLKIDLKVRGNSETLAAGVGTCFDKSPKEVQCNFDGDGGKVTLSGDGNSTFRVKVDFLKVEDSRAKETFIQGTLGGDDLFIFTGKETDCVSVN